MNGGVASTTCLAWPNRVAFGRRYEFPYPCLADEPLWVVLDFNEYTPPWFATAQSGK